MTSTPDPFTGPGPHVAPDGAPSGETGPDGLDALPGWLRRAVLGWGVRRSPASWVGGVLGGVAERYRIDPLLARGASPEEASERARTMLARLNLPQRLWDLAPATFSGGEQQRVNIARSFVDPSPIMLIDEAETVVDAEHDRLLAKAAADGLHPTFEA